MPQLPSGRPVGISYERLLDWVESAPFGRLSQVLLNLHAVEDFHVLIDLIEYADPDPDPDSDSDSDPDPDLRPAQPSPARRTRAEVSRSRAWFVSMSSRPAPARGQRLTRQHWSSGCTALACSSCSSTPKRNCCESGSIAFGVETARA